MAVTLYRQVGKGKNRRYKKVNLGPGRRPAAMAGPYFLRYSLSDGTRTWEKTSPDERRDSHVQVSLISTDSFHGVQDILKGWTPDARGVFTADLNRARRH